MKLVIMGTLAAAVLFFSGEAEAKYRNTYHRNHHRHVTTHKFSRYLVARWRHHVRVGYRTDHRGRGHRFQGGLDRVKLDNGSVIVVASRYAERFTGFFHDLFAREGRLPDIGCLANGGHIRNSLHYWGGACDVGQKSRNVAWRPMYHISDLARKWGLTDGCWWGSSPDCGHIEVNRAVAFSPPRAVPMRWAWAAPL